MTEDNTLPRRRFLKATGAIPGTSALAYCPDGQESTENANGDGRKPSTESSETMAETPKRGGTLQLRSVSLTTFDPIKATGPSLSVIQQMFDALMNYPNAETAVEPQLASGYEISDDFTTYSFSLKEGATFHNGEEVTASDFVYAWERLAASPHSRRSHFLLDNLGVKHELSDGAYEPGSLAVEAIDDYTLTFELDKPFASTLEILAYSAFVAIPEGIITDEPSEESTEPPSDAYREFAMSNPIGAGPFEFDRWKRSIEAQVVRYEDYHGKTALLDAVHWQIIEDDNTAYEYSMNRNADIFSIPTAHYDQSKVSVEETDERGRSVGTYGPLRNGETVNYLRVPQLSTEFVGFHQEHVPKPVRQAFAYVTDRQEFIEQVFKNRRLPGYHLIPPIIYPGTRDAYDQHVENEYPYGVGETNIDAAKRVMENAGYGPDNRVEVQWTQYNSSTWKEIAKLLRDRLAAAYIDMSIEEGPFSTVLERGFNGNLEVYPLGWVTDWPAPDTFLQLIAPRNTDTSSSGPLGFVDWDDTATEAMHQAAEAWQTVLDNPQSTDEAQEIRNEAYVSMEEANWKDVVHLTISHDVAERFWYENVHVPKVGAMGNGRQKHNRTWKE